jgi:hypothetical protein
MELSTLVAAWCALMATFQGLGSILQFVDRFSSPKIEEGGVPIRPKPNSLLIAIFLLIGAFITIGFGTWMFVSKPLRPTEKIVDRPVVTKEYVPCPPTKSGNATTKGNGSPAISGSNNTTTVGPPDNSKPH